MSACSTGDDPGTGAAAGEETAGETDAAVDEERTELIIGVGEDTHPGEEMDMKRLGRYPLQTDVCEGLVRLTEDFGVEEVLAESWEQDGNTLRFELRDDVTFHDGSPMTAEDVVYSMDYQAEEPQTSGFSQVGTESTEAVDDHTVEITPDVENYRLLEQINHPTYWVAAPGSDPLEDPASINCTGPYMLEDYVEEDHLTVVRNDEYWGDEPGMLERITFRFIPDEATRALALQSGEIDVAMNLERAQIEPLRGTPGLQIVDAPPGQVHLMFFAFRGQDGEDKPLGEREVREAVAHAVDQEAYVNGVLDGHGEVVETVNPPVVLGEHADRVEGYEHDPARAEEILEDAGWELGDDGVRERDGEQLSLELIYNPSQLSLSPAEFVQSQLAEVGIDVNITQHADTASYSTQRADGDFDINIETPNQNDANPAFLISLRWYSAGPGDNVEYVMPGPDTRFDELITEIETASEDELQELAAEAMHELVDVEIATVPLAGTFRQYAMHEDLAGFEPHPSGTNQTWRSVYWTTGGE